MIKKEEKRGICNKKIQQHELNYQQQWQKQQKWRIEIEKKKI